MDGEKKSDREEVWVPDDWDFSNPSEDTLKMVNF